MTVLSIVVDLLVGAGGRPSCGCWVALLGMVGDCHWDSGMVGDRPEGRG